MGRYLLGRVLRTLVALWAIVSATFLVMHLIPGNPFLARQLPPAVAQHLLARYGLDMPLWRQYVLYWAGLLHGRLGSSMVVPGRTVRQIVAAAFPVSAELGAEALLWSVTLGVALGLLAAFHLNRAWDYCALAVAVLGLSVPNFAIAAILDYVLGVRARLLPVAGWGGFAHTVMPAFALGFMSLALVSRLLRTQGAEVLAMEYVRTARAKGLAWPAIVVRHVLRNALLPVLTVLGPLAAAVLSGSFAVEQIFAIPGLGSAYVQSILDRDYPVILGVTVFYAFVLLGFNLLVDVLYGLVDPRIRLGREGG